MKASVRWVYMGLCLCVCALLWATFFHGKSIRAIHISSFGLFVWSSLVLFISCLLSSSSLSANVCLDDVFIFFFLSHDKTHSERANRHRWKAQSTSKMVCTKCIPNYAVWTTVFSSQRSIWRHCASFFLRIFSAPLPHTLLYFCAGQVFRSLSSVRNQWLLAHRYFKRDSHSQARKTIKTKNKKRNKNRLPIRVPRAHTHFLFVRSFASFFIFFRFILKLYRCAHQYHSSNINERQVKPTEIFIRFFLLRSQLYFVFLAAALRFDVSTTLAIKPNLFFVVAVVVDVVVLRSTGQKFVQPNLCIYLYRVLLS